jgi:hypothetical protein
MTLQYILGLVVLASGVGAIIGDLESFTAARKLDKTVQFDWHLCAVKFTKGVCGAILLSIPALPKT